MTSGLDRVITSGSTFVGSRISAVVYFSFSLNRLKVVENNAMVWVQILYWLWQSHLIFFSDEILQQEYDMKKIFASVLLLLAPSIGFAGGHGGLGGHGTGVVTNTEAMQGKTEESNVAFGTVEANISKNDQSSVDTKSSEVAGLYPSKQ